MPNDHVMCFKVWNELYSSLTHRYHDNSQSNVHFDSHDYSDDITDGEISSDNIQCSSPFTMDTIQHRIHHLLDCPEEEKLSSSLDLYLANQEAPNEHTSIESDNTGNHNQVISPYKTFEAGNFVVSNSFSLQIVQCPIFSVIITRSKFACIREII